MPTVAGDIVIAHAQDGDRKYSIWPVVFDGQQSANPLADTSYVIGFYPAIAFARKMTAQRRGGAIYTLDLGTLVWARIFD